MNLQAIAALVDELEKVAEVATPLLPHQQRVVDRIKKEDQPGLLVIHGLGSGKTLTSIAAHDALGEKAEVVAPAALLGNYRKEREKHLKGPSPKADLMSMQNMATKGILPSAPVLIVDEAHRARDPNSATFQALKGNTSKKRLLLSGSPFYNHPSDVASLVNLAADARILPHDKDEFTRRYITEKPVDPGLTQRFLNRFRSPDAQVKPGSVPQLYSKNTPELRAAFEKWIDYHPGSTEGFPEVTRRTVEVPMTPAQLKVYDTLMGQAPPWVAAKIKRGLPPSKQEASQLNAFLGAVRQAVNTTAPFTPGQPAEEPKIQKAFENLKTTLDSDPTARAVVYSNYLPAGIDPYKRRLDEAKIPYGEFTGQMPSKKRDQLVQDYNAGKLRALLLSSAGGEGLDLKGTRLMQILEPHWNYEKLKQVEGRGARYKSHLDLPEEKRKLLVENYLATRPQGLTSKALGYVLNRAPDKSVDEYLTQMSQDKANLIEQFRGLLPKHEKTAAAKKPVVTKETSDLASSWRPTLAATALIGGKVVPTFWGLGSFYGSILHGKKGADVGRLLGGAGGLALSAGIGRFVAKNITRDAQKLTREALKDPSKENALREQADKIDWAVPKNEAIMSAVPILYNTGMTGLSGAVSGISAGLPRELVTRHALQQALLSAGPSLGGLALATYGGAKLDQYKRRIAANELDNMRAHEGMRDAERLKRLRKTVSALETKVEGDGWKSDADRGIVPEPSPEPAVKKDKKTKVFSNKDW